MSATPIFSTHIEALPVSVYETNAHVGQAAAGHAAEFLKETLDARGQANVILATGNSQLSFLEALRSASDLDWSKVSIFHMDEYLGLDPAHPASFPLFLRRHFLEYLQPPAGAFFPVPGQHPDTAQACQEYETLLRAYPADLCALGIGENGHLAFNDPPANFETDEPFIIVDLDEACRRQQVGEGWCASFEDVPKRAISMSIRQILKSDQIVCTVPDARKAIAVKNTVEGMVTNLVPASILQEHIACQLFLDAQAAGQLKQGRG